MIAERQRLVADDLSGLVALAGDQQRIARLQRRDRRRGWPRRGRRSRSRLWRAARMAARIVAGFSLRGLSSVTMTLIGVLGRDRAHHRALARRRGRRRRRTHDELALGIRPQRLQRFRQRVGLVRVIDEDRRAVALADAFEPALGAFEMFEAANTASASLPVPMARPAATSAFSIWNSPTSGSLIVYLRPRCSSASFCAKPSIDASTRRMPSPVPSALRPTAMIRRLRERAGVDHFRRAIMIGRDHRGPAGRDEIAEQPQFCGQVMRDDQDDNPCGRATGW